MQTTIITAGLDEAGRGPLAGPVVAAAVILDPNNPIDGLNDSKKLSEKKREHLFNVIQEKSLAWAIASANVIEIDTINILQASLLAMQRACEQLQIQPQLALVDGNKCPQLAIPTKAIIGGDATVAEISAASILAKVSRDREMVKLDQQYPGYGLAKHKGYPTKFHIERLHELGVSKIHRRSFAPVRQLLNRL